MAHLGSCNPERILYPPKFNSSPLKSYRNPIGKDRLPTTIFQGPAVKLRGHILFHTSLGLLLPQSCQHYITITRWLFQICFIFTPKPWGNDPILTSIFFRWVESKPPTRHRSFKEKALVHCSCWLGVGGLSSRETPHSLQGMSPFFF